MKERRQRRFEQKENHLQDQLRLARRVGSRDLSQPHRFHKKKVMDCGKTMCCMCSANKVLGERTIQEKRFTQDERQLLIEDNENL
jgi:hypothetical protein